MSWSVLMVAIAALVSTEPASWTPDRLHYELRGLMSSSTEFDLNLATGDYYLNEGAITT